jgi:hypothetical protein
LENKKIQIFTTCENPGCISLEHLTCTTIQRGRILNYIGWKHQDKPTNEISRLKSLQILMQHGTKQDDCLVYNRKIYNIFGYGQVNWKGTTISAHRLAWILQKGEIPKGLFVLHKCKTKACFNIDHLELGTAEKNNYEDKLRDGTLVRGSQHYKSEITEEIAQEIKNSLGQDTRKDRAKKFNVSLDIISDIDRGKSWHYLPRNGEYVHTEVHKYNRLLAKNRMKTRTPPTKEDYEKTWNLAKSKSIITENGCFVKQNNNITSYYEYCKLKGKQRMLHIVSWEIHHGNCIEYAAGDLQVRHLCGNSKCFNPDHLDIGDAKDQADDRRKHGTATGIDAETAKKIYELKGKQTQKEIAQMFNVGKDCVQQIHTKRTHKYLHEE